jgi:putative ABC transport system substrate-binding protein
MKGPVRRFNSSCPCSRRRRHDRAPSSCRPPTRCEWLSKGCGAWVRKWLHHHIRRIAVLSSLSEGELADPGGNFTGFINIEGSLGGKWPELMRDVAPRIRRIAIMFNAVTAPYARYYVYAFRSAASALSIEALEYQVQSAAEIEAAMAKLGGGADTGLVLIPDTFVLLNRQTIISLADRYRLPAIYPFDFFVSDGGLMSYGVDVTDLFRGAASYVDRILHGGKPSELAVQIPTKFQLAVNLKTAKALGLEMPPLLLTRADEVIE